MDRQKLSKLTKSFEEFANTKEGIEFWYARDLQKLLRYTEWRNFLKIIKRAQESCKRAHFEVSDHFVGVNKTIDLPKGAKREIQDIVLTRYACYLIAQNGDPRKDSIAFAQSYLDQTIEDSSQQLILSNEAHKEN